MAQAMGPETQAAAQVDTTDPNCQQTRRDGRPCAARPLADGRCFAHSPTTADQRAAARRRGGQHSAKVVRLRGLLPVRLLPVYDRLEEALAQTHAGELEPRQAQAMAVLARALVTVLTAGELEERVRRLEASAADER